ncbi:sodium/proton-translocating pyrophosphatase, partial [Flavobacteriaceae bacterium]|nr:sodium/proton-translocating pyrophosphatase [Flavobacteriaceae bacterium]
IGFPLLIAFVPMIFGMDNLAIAEMLGGYMAGVTVSGVLWAIFQNNAGGAWDNAKKSFEAGVEINGVMTYKGSDAHKAAVTGDTVGDPFKDTSGPSMNILIKLTCLIGLVIAPILGGHSLDTDHVSADIEVKKEVILKNDNNVWTMSVTSNENDNGEITNTIETISGSEEEVMSALREYNLNEVEKLAASAMAKIEK